MARIHSDPRDWIARRRLHGLLLRGRGAAAPGDVARELTAMQAQEHGYARWSIAQRAAGSPGAPVVDAAFDEGCILRTHLLRPTWHYVAPADLRWLMRLSGPRVNAGRPPMEGGGAVTFHSAGPFSRQCCLQMKPGFEPAPRRVVIT